MLRQAAAEASESYVNALLQDYCEEDAHVFSLRFEKKMKKLLHRAAHRRFYRIRNRAASVLLALLLGSGLWLTFDVDARAAFFGWVRETYETFFVYHFSGTSLPSAQSQIYGLSDLPEGYSQVFSSDTEFGRSALYADSAGHFLQFEYVYAPGAANFHVDRTNTTLQQTVINGCSADLLLSSAPGISSVILWTDEYGTAFYLSAFLPPDELVHLAEHVISIPATP